MSLELISFKLCPFVQRSVITLLHKSVEHDITYIDLGNPPEWFQSISPLGKVPVLKVGDDVLFESAVINEYIDETTGTPLMPADPLTRAKNRAWIEFTSNLLMAQFQLVMAKDKEQFLAKKQQLLNDLNRLEQQLGDGPYFNGEGFSLVDTAVAPFFTRFSLINSITPLVEDGQLPKLMKLGNHLMSLPEVKHSVVEEFDGMFMKMISAQGSYLSTLVES